MKDKHVIKWALIIFVSTLLWFLFEKKMGWHGEKIALHAQFSIIYDLLFLVIYLMAFWDKKNHLQKDQKTFKQLFYFGMNLTTVVTILSPVVQSIFHKLISPDFFARVITLAVDYNLLSRNAAERKYNLSNYILENIVGTFLFGAFLSLIIAGILVKFSKKD